MTEPPKEKAPDVGSEEGLKYSDDTETVTGDEDLSISTDENQRILARCARRKPLSEKQKGAYIKIVEELEARRFDLHKKPREALPRFLVSGKAVSTPGNLTAIIGQAKGGKSAFLGAAMSAWVCATTGTRGRDTLGVSATCVEGALIHIDTEQSEADHWAMVERALRRAGVAQAPDQLLSYSLAGTPARAIRNNLAALLYQNAPTGIFAVIIDGVADLVTDVNDAAECNELVSQLHDAAIRYECPIVCVLHENPTHDTGKARGHLGSQLERKAESNLRIKKVDGVSVVYSERQRRAPILESEGPRFAWSDEHGCHMSVAPGEDPKAEEKRRELRSLASEAFGGNSRMKWADLKAAIMRARDCASATAERRIKEMDRMMVIRDDAIGFKERVL